MKKSNNDYMYKNYMEKYDPDAPNNIIKKKKERRIKRKNWWKANWINFVTMLIAVLTLIATILFGVLR